jgi:methyltransferase
VVFHVLWLVAIATERLVLGARIPGPALAGPVAGALVLVEVARVWILATLGRRWTIQVVVLPGEHPVRRGPYRFLRHPNYAVVLSEVVLVPLLVGAFFTAAVAWLPALFLLVERVRREEAAWRSVAGTSLCRTP